MRTNQGFYNNYEPKWMATISKLSNYWVICHCLINFNIIFKVIKNEEHVYWIKSNSNFMWTSLWF